MDFGNPDNPVPGFSERVVTAWIQFWLEDISELGKLFTGLYAQDAIAAGLVVDVEQRQGVSGAKSILWCGLVLTLLCPKRPP